MHKKLIRELRARGYYPNGKKPVATELAESFDKATGIFDDALAGNDLHWSKGFLSQRLSAILAGIEEIVENKREKTTFHQNLETGQIVPHRDLMVAVNLWPLEEVLELIP